ncbi:hypothetical protein C8R43DRAFT_1029514 [Mycena crocata]|nr:hypothetical protein C8R43DRAFT_1029514 [Mycena crocata]
MASPSSSSIASSSVTVSSSNPTSSSAPTSSTTTTTTSSLPPSSSDAPTSSTTHISSSADRPPSSPSISPTETTTRTSAATGAPQTDPPATLRSTVFVTTTDNLGHMTVSAPSAITSIVIFTSNGVPVTTTEVKVNPTLGSDGQSSGSSSFFKNTGAVAGVFVLVGLVAAAIVLFVLFALRRRRNRRREKHDTAVKIATLAAAGFHRTPLDDDELQGNGSRHSRAFATPDMEMRTGSALALGTHSSLPSAGRTSGYYHDSSGLDEAIQDGFDPYHEYDVNPGPREGYAPARTHSPPPAAYHEPYRDASGSEPNHAISHSASQSVGSTEPLLASFNRVSPAPSGARLGPPTPPPRNPKRVSDNISQMPAPTPRPENRRQSTASSVYSSESTGDERLNPALRNSDIQDSEDYSRRVLGVRNIPDGVSGVSVSGES